MEDGQRGRWGVKQTEEVNSGMEKEVTKYTRKQETGDTNDEMKMDDL